MGIQIIDDHDGSVLPADTIPTEIFIRGLGPKREFYLSEASLTKLELLLADFLEPKQRMVEIPAYEDKSDDAREYDFSDEELERLTRPDAIDSGHAERVADPRFETYGFTAAEVRAFCKRNGVEVGERGLVSQSAYNALKASEDLGDGETVQEMRARLEAEFAEVGVAEPGDTSGRVASSSRVGQGVGVPKTFHASRDEYASLDAQTRRLLDSFDDDKYRLVAVDQPNDRMAMAIKRGTGNFVGLTGFTAKCKTAKSGRTFIAEGTGNEKTYVDIYARRIK